MSNEDIKKRLRAVNRKPNNKRGSYVKPTTISCANCGKPKTIMRGAVRDNNFCDLLCRNEYLSKKNQEKKKNEKYVQ